MAAGASAAISRIAEGAAFAPANVVPGFLQRRLMSMLRAIQKMLSFMRILLKKEMKGA